MTNQVHQSDNSRTFTILNISEQDCGKHCRTSKFIVHLFMSHNEVKCILKLATPYHKKDSNTAKD